MKNKDTFTFSAIIHKEEDMYVAECPETQTVSQEKTIDEAIENLKESTELYLEEFPIENKAKPLMTTFEVQHVKTPEALRA
ncbi:MAG: type II toxin-antitoxin system HicB family antitoxin [Candidatus Aenigmarchaeota archaeon]|nr:type II toxin-antitoxin system HicB family antitoxin [Candidatus Aenigmarchaeota archaeon]